MKNQKKYFVCFKPKGEFYAFVKSLSGLIEMLNPDIVALYKEELLHITFHKPIVGDHKKDLSDFLKFLVKNYSGTWVTLSGLGIFNNNIVALINPTYDVARLWVSVRNFAEQLSGEQGDGDNTLHVTLFKKVPDIKSVRLFELAKNIPLTGVRFPFEYVCLFEKIDNGPWVEIERLRLLPM